MNKWIFCVVTVLALCNAVAKADAPTNKAPVALPDIVGPPIGDVLIDLPTVLDFDEDYYNECLLKNVKPGVDRSATGVIMQACKYKATPKKCRALYDAISIYTSSSERSKCVAACKTESYYSRTFGGCSTG